MGGAAYAARINFEPLFPQRLTLYFDIAPHGAVAEREVAPA
jgi:hypothetical protein